MNFQKFFKKWERQEMQWTKTSIIFLCSAIAAAVVFLSCGIVFGVSYVKRMRAEESYQDLEEEFVKKQPQEKKEKEKQLPPEYYFVVDFEALQQENPDIYAWIKIPGTKVSYPILQHAQDNSYYLNYTVKKKKGLPGSIYSENMNPKDFSSFIHILYGHNMNNGTMFASLHQYETEGFLEENQFIYVYTKKQLNVYKIFAAVVADNRHIMSEYDFETEEGKQGFIDYVCGLAKNGNAKNHYLEGTEVTTKDKILTLSTCVGGNKKRRYLVNAVLTEVVLYTTENTEEEAPKEEVKNEDQQQGASESVWDEVIKDPNKVQVIDKIPEEDNKGAGKVQ